MSAIATTDNFLPYARGKSYYKSRPILRSSRRHSRRQPISDFIVPKAYPSKLQLAFIGSVASTRLTPTFAGQFAPDLPPKIHLKSRLLRTRLIYAFMVFSIAFGINAGLMKPDSRPPAGKPKALHSVVAANPVSSTEHTQTSVGLPKRLEIPKINVDAALDHVGITSQGKLDVPTNPANAAWYDQGPRPGETGTAVIDGHFGYRDHTPAAFDNLHTLQKGDKLYVKDEKGMTTVFVVRELRRYDSDEYAPAVFRSSDGQSHLNLITCEGIWNKTQKSFSNRLVVFADKTNE